MIILFTKKDELNKYLIYLTSNKDYNWNDVIFIVLVTKCIQGHTKSHLISL